MQLISIEEAIKKGILNIGISGEIGKTAKYQITTDKVDENRLNELLSKITEPSIVITDDKRILGTQIYDYDRENLRDLNFRFVRTYTPDNTPILVEGEDYPYSRDAVQDNYEKDLEYEYKIDTATGIIPFKERIYRETSGPKTKKIELEHPVRIFYKDGIFTIEGNINLEENSEYYETIPIINQDMINGVTQRFETNDGRKILSYGAEISNKISRSLYIEEIIEKVKEINVIGDVPENNIRIGASGVTDGSPWFIKANPEKIVKGEKTISEMIKENLNIYLETVKKNMNTIENIPEEILEENPEIRELIVEEEKAEKKRKEESKKRREFLKNASKEELEANIEMCIEAVKEDRRMASILPKEIVKANPEIALEAARDGEYFYLKDIPEKLLEANPEICIEAVVCSSRNMKHIPKEILKANPEICMKKLNIALENGWKEELNYIIQYIPEEVLRTNLETCVDVVKEEPSCIQYIPEKILEEHPENSRYAGIEEFFHDIDEAAKDAELSEKIEESKELDGKIEQAGELLAEYQKQDPEQQKEGEAIGAN